MPEHFQKRMMMILEGLDGVLCLIDVVVFGKDQQEHDARRKAVLESLKSKKVTLNGQLKLLGHLIDKNGIQPNPPKNSCHTEDKTS